MKIRFNQQVIFSKFIKTLKRFGIWKIRITSSYSQMNDGYSIITLTRVEEWYEWDAKLQTEVKRTTTK